MPPFEVDTLTVLRIRSMDAFYDRSHVLFDVSLTVARGTSVGLLGRNGMGKTTLIKSCLGLVKDARGDVSFHGRRVTGLPPEKIACMGVGYVPEGRGIFASLTVRENLLMAARPGPAGQTPWDLERVLRLFPRLAERLHNAGNQLSGGEQQMLSIGRALMTNPDLLVIDEVTEGLAPLVVKEIWSVVEAVRRAGVSCLLVDRSHQAILRNTEFCYFIEKGRIVWSGRSEVAAVDKDLLERYLGV